MTIYQYLESIKLSSTVYVGNLAFYTSEEQILKLFSSAGCIKNLVMGLNQIKRTPCGFCFIEYYSRSSALTAVNFLNNTMLDKKKIYVNIDPGMKEGRQ